ncbi:L,D-transpeptidase family protein [Desulforapulum autotrophicum]|uniref:L,D-transpeptidase family protein n=1 Tax=Desulforapulum autotrophicum TaxID=2296 RepID=UPI0002EE1A11|nr:L,D-transpeptidase family protein [Desulforapulum autotrophicum]
MPAVDGIASEEDLARAMADHLECYPVELLSFKDQKPSIASEDVCLATIYHELGAKPLWVSVDGPGMRAEIIARYLKYADKEGLDPADYQVEKIEGLWTDPSLESLAKLDTLLTYNMVKYIHDVSYGQLKSYMVNPELFAEAGERGFDPLKMVETILATENLDEFFQSLPPQHHQYRGLRKGLLHYGLLKYSGKWKDLSGTESIRPGDEDERIVEIRKRIALLENDNKEISKSAEPSVYDHELLKKVVLFQQTHGLVQDGIIGRNTIQELNKSPEDRVDQIKINMARWRWQDHGLGDKYILVNIANYSLYACKTGELKFSMPVIVGKFQHQTPVFSDKIKYLELNPYWNVPSSIAVNEDLPGLRKNPSYLVEKNIRLFSNWQKDGVEIDSTAINWKRVTPSEMARFKLRQDPGPTNALGRVKFVFPNHYSVYLHDSPAKRLFSEQKRSFSHGCIRVSEPEKLAVFLLDEEGSEWNIEQIHDLISQGKRKVLKIRLPVPVHITYQTAWVDKDDEILFNGDVYGRDEKLYKALIIK